MKTEYINEAKEMNTNGKNIGQIEGYMRFTYNLSVKESKEVIKKAGLSQDNNKANWEDTVMMLRQSYGKISKTDLINKMCKINGKTYNSNQHAYNYIAMCQEWAKQEVANIVTK